MSQEISVFFQKDDSCPNRCQRPGYRKGHNRIFFWHVIFLALDTLGSKFKIDNPATLYTPLSKVLSVPQI